MQFVVIGIDGMDEEAVARRMAAREGHIAVSAQAVEKGEQILGAAILDEGGVMRGSVMVVDFPDRDALDAWLANEPYVTGNVWRKIDIFPCRIGPSFAHLVK